MTNNDIFRRVCYIFDLKANEIAEVFSLADFDVTDQQPASWLKQEQEKEFIELGDKELAVFLNGFINFKRGKREGEQAKPEETLNNNIVFQKIRIALNFKTEDVLQVLQLVDIHLSKHELSALFRKPTNKHYRECNDHVFEGFLLGLQRQLLPSDTE